MAEVIKSIIAYNHSYEMIKSDVKLVGGVILNDNVERHSTMIKPIGLRQKTWSLYRESSLFLM